MTDLNPCPYCGGEARIIDGPDGLHSSAMCRNSGCGERIRPRRTTADAIAAWNRRASGWISVEERLPEKNLLVLAWYEGTTQHHGSIWRRYGFGFAVHWGDNGWDDRLMREAEEKLDADTLVITHWQPLPEPPEETS